MPSDEFAFHPSVSPPHTRTFPGLQLQNYRDLDQNKALESPGSELGKESPVPGSSKESLLVSVLQKESPVCGDGAVMGVCGDRASVVVSDISTVICK